MAVEGRVENVLVRRASVLVKGVGSMGESRRG